MKFSFYTLGCKVNRFETQALEQLVRASGHEVVERNADICIVNTCTVTSVSDHKNIRAFHKMRKENPNAVIAACGCYAQMSPEMVLAQGDVDLVCGTGERAELIARCIRAVEGREDVSLPGEPPRAFEALPAGVPNGRTRALLKVQDGCDNYCAYCIIPYARGHVRSMPPDEVVNQVRKLRERNVREIVLTGIEIASYGSDLPDRPGLPELIAAVCTEAAGARVRLSSLEPRVIDVAFCNALRAYDNLARHFHVSLQSGCDSVLARMKRKYSTAQFLQATERLRNVFPDCSLTTDLIVGFPGETEEEFEQTLDFIRRCAFAQVHVFPYSPREGTVAANMDGQLSQEVKMRRAQAAKAVAQQMSEDFLERFTGRTLDVLLEHSVRQGRWSGHAEYHFPVEVEIQEGKRNQVVHVLITGHSGGGLFGKAI